MPDWSQPEIQRALVQGGLNFLGVVITGGVAIFIWWRNRARERGDRAALRAERKEDLRLALWADILPVWTGLFQLGTDEEKLASVDAAFEAAEKAGEDYTPFVVAMIEPLFGDKVVEDIAVLDAGREIETIVQLMHQITRHNALAEQMRHPTFLSLSKARQKSGLSQLMNLVVQVEHDALAALKELERRMAEPPETGMERRLQLETVRRRDQKKGKGS